jgi:3'-phosphoadenosine 5'-phosphosulfate (PAPS) 3'-phosphatase
VILRAIPELAKEPISPEWTGPGNLICLDSRRNASATIFTERGIEKRISGLVGEHPRHQRDLDGAIAAALAAGAVVRKFYDEDTAATYAKGDGSPVTDADLAADQAIRRVLTKRFPDDAILSEEVQDDDYRLDVARCWIVDPIDGTEQFIRRTGEFDVLVALVENGRPVAVAGYQPSTRLLVTAQNTGAAWLRSGDGAWRRVHFEPAGAQLRIGTSKWFGSPGNAAIIDSVANRLRVTQERPAATGFSPRLFLPPREIDVMIGVRAGTDQTMASEWDFAVTDLVIHEAGGKVTDLSGEQFRYNKPVPHNVGGLVAAADPASHAHVLVALQPELDGL